MTSVLLCTYRNGFFLNPLLNAGYQVKEIMLINDIEVSCNFIDDPEFDYVIFELYDNNLHLLEKILSHIKNPRIICLASDKKKLDKIKLLSLGIVDILDGINSEEPYEYIKVLSKDRTGSYGRIVVWDDDPAIRRCISLIAEGYDYIVITVDSIDSLVEKMEIPAAQFVLINITAKKLRLKELIAKSVSAGLFKSKPAIIYKDLSRGIFIHEIVSGLNRITNCIVDYAELFSFLAVNLYKKRIIPQYFSFGNKLSADNNQIYAKDTLSRIIFSRGTTLFEGDDTFSNENVEEKLDLLMDMVDIIEQSKGFRWLINEKKENVITCGAGGAV